MFRKPSNVLFWALVLLSVILVTSGCKELPPATFKDLIENRIGYTEDSWPREYTDGAMVYLAEKNGGEFFVATYPGVSKEKIKDDFIIVKAPIKGLTVGDIVSIRGTVNKATGEAKSGKRVTVYYLTCVDGRPIKTGKTNVEDPDFEELVRIVSEEIQRKDSDLDFLAVYAVVFLPMFR